MIPFKAIIRHPCNYGLCYNDPMLADVGFIDTHMHLHLAQFDADRAEVLSRAATNGVARMIEIGYDLASSQAAVALAEQHQQIFAVVGIQPHYAAQADASWLAEVRRLAAHPKVVAIGEIGLDYFHDRAPHDQQERLFREQLALARELASRWSSIAATRKPTRCASCGRRRAGSRA